MSLLSFLSLLSFCIFLITGVYVLLDNVKSSLHQSFFLLSLAFAIYALAYTFYYNAPSKDIALIWFKVSSVGWILFPAFVLNFAFAMTNDERHFRNLIAQPLIFLPGSIFLVQSLSQQLYANDFIHMSNFWKFVPDFSSPWLWLFLFYVSGYLLLSFIVIFRWKKRAVLKQDQIKSTLILWALSISFLLSMASNFIFPLLGQNAIPEFAHLSCGIMIIAFGFAIVKYKYQAINFEAASTIISSSTRELIFLSDEHFTINNCNKHAAKFLGYSVGKIAGKSMLDFVDLPNNTMSEIDKSPKYPFNFATDLELKTRAGEEIPVHMVCRTVINEFDDLSGYVFVAFDRRPELHLAREIEERRNLQYELAKAREKVEESDKLKSTFLSNVSHELRTPLGGILGFAGILKLELTDPTLLEMADHIDKSGNRLLGTLNAIIDLSLIETNKNEIDKQVVNITELIQIQTSLYSKYAESKKLYLNFKVSDQTIMARTDGKILGHVINNLLDNAIKYTDEGGVEVSGELISSGKRSWALIKVKDTGIGIDKSDFSKIFERFRQSSEGQNRDYQGLGIGLSICKYFVELLDGEIWIESKPGKGSAFYVKIPAYYSRQNFEGAAKNEDKESTEQKAKLSTLELKPCVLIVEDEKSNQAYMKYLLSELYEVDTCTSGTNALEMVQKNKYDLIFMDVNLDREMSGIEAMKKIRLIDNCSDTIIAAVTANVLKNSREQLLKSGFTHYLAKPFTRENLLKLANDMLAHLNKAN